MAASKTGSKKTPKSHYVVFSQKAEKFYFEMAEAMSQNRWNAAGLLAVHCAISITDAICSKALGRIHSGPSHGEAAKFLSLNYPSAKAQSRAGQLAKIISQKHLVEYEDRVFTRKEAEETVKRVNRFYQWARQELS